MRAARGPRPKTRQVIARGGSPDRADDPVIDLDAAQRAKGRRAASDPEGAETDLRCGCCGAERSRLEPIEAFVATLRAHASGIIAWSQNRLSNGLVEATSSPVQGAKRRSWSYREMVTILCLIAGKLPLPEIPAM